MAMVRILGPGQVDAVLKATDKKLRAAVKLAVLEAAAVGAEIVSRDAPVDTGRLKQSIIVRKRGASGHPEIVAQAPYAGPVEVGSRPHWVPLGPLVRWVRHHKSLFNGGGPARNKKGQFKGGEAVRIARAIQRAIARRGTRPRYFMRKNLPRLNEILKTLMRESKARALASLGGP